MIETRASSAIIFKGLRNFESLSQVNGENYWCSAEILILMHKNGSGVPK
jgi:uncharacterized protein with ATP-grasp and redox domains